MLHAQTGRWATTRWQIATQSRNTSDGVPFISLWLEAELSDVLTHLQRMTFGDQPPIFLLEIIFRTLIVYAYTLGLMRWLGSRTIGQLSTVEFLLVIALGSAVGDAMFYPDVPLVHALLVITVVVVVNKGLDMLIARNKRAERVIDGVPDEAVHAGTITAAFLKSDNLSRNELFQQLREHGIEHLGQVSSAFIETDGVLTVFRSPQPRPGLPIVPPWDIEAPERIKDTWPVGGGPLVCRRCGNASRSRSVKLGACTSCGHDEWTWAATTARDSNASTQ